MFYAKKIKCWNGNFGEKDDKKDSIIQLNWIDDTLTRLLLSFAGHFLC